MFNSFPSIEGFHRVRKDVTKYVLVNGPVNYGAKVKLHGTNAGILIKPDGRVMAQSRSRIITSGDDNMGFARWVEDTSHYWQQFTENYKDVTIYGEWCGKGIMKGVSISDIGEKIFAVFMAQTGSSDDEDATVSFEPTELINMLFHSSLYRPPNNVFILPWYEDNIVVDFFNPSQLEDVVGEMNKMVADVEKCDPWVKEHFDIEGMGEGLVFYPMKERSRHVMSSLMFKAKGENHKVVKDRASVEIDPKTAEDIKQFSIQVVTEARCEQFAREVASGELVFDMKLLGPFLGSLSKDVKKDITNGEVELPEDTEWKLVNKNVTQNARIWYIAKVNEI
tara:strand:+ start:4397 stop:5404 length:1008 start_codon:yes stop_codon:yes gene_type:complete